MAVPTLLYESENWAPTNRDKFKIQASEMRFIRRVTGVIPKDQLRNETIRQDLQVFAMNDKINDYRQRWIEYLN